MIFLALIAAIRGWIFSDDFGFKLLQAGCITLLIFLVATFFISRRGFSVYANDLAEGMVAASMVFLCINAFNYIYGYGFVPGNPRFFGSSIHPNFIGIQLAICNLTIFSKVRKNFHFKNLIIILLLLVGFLMQINTGSRSSLLVFGAGVLGYFFAQSKFKLNKNLIFYGLLLFLTLMIFLYFVPSDILLALDRGANGGDTRSEAWSQMISKIYENIFFGAGHFVGASENSYLRFIVTYGIIYGVMILLLIIKAVKNLFMLNKLHGAHITSLNLFFGLFVGLLVGGSFEGYLADVWSFPQTIFLLLISVCVSNFSFVNKKISES